MPRYRAFLIGVSQYSHGFDPLPFVSDDLQALSRTLSTAGYEVEVHASTNPGLNEIRSRVGNFISSARKGDTSLVYLSGHGIHHDGTDYLLPADVEVDELFPRQSCVALDIWKTRITAYAGENLVFFVDACREGVSVTMTKSVQAQAWGKADIGAYNKQKIAYIYACGPGQRAFYATDESRSFSVLSRALEQVAEDAAGPVTLAGVTTVLAAKVEQILRQHGKGPQQIHYREGVSQVNPKQFVLFPGEHRHDPEEEPPVPDPVKRPWYKRAKVWVAAATVAAVLVAAAFYFGESPDEPCCTPVELTFDTWGDLGSDILGYSGLFAEYTKRHPHVTIKQNWAPSLEQHADNIQAGLRSGEGLGDIVVAEEAIMGDMYVRPADWADLRPLVGDLSKEYVPSRWEGGQTPDGKRVLGIPTDLQTIAMCYRRDLFSAAGLPTERSVVSGLWPTWDAFLATAKRYKETTGLPMLDNARQAFTAMALQGGDPLFYDRENVFAADKSEGLRKAWDASIAMIKADITARAQTYGPQWEQGMNTNAFATTLCPNWILQLIELKAGPSLKGKWDIAALPGKGAHWGGSWLSIPTQSKHKAEAAALVKFLTSKEGQLAAFTKQAGVFPAHLGAIQSEQVQSVRAPYFNEAPAGQIYTAAAAAIQYVYLGCRYTTIMEKAFAHAVNQAEHGQDPEQLWVQALSDARRFRC